MEETFNYENPAEDRNLKQQDTQQEFNPSAIGEVTERSKIRGCGPRRRKRSRSKIRGCGPRPKRRRRRKSKCICKPKRRRRRLIRSSNPFLIFYLEMWFRSSGRKRVTQVAREAGRKWCALPKDRKRKYIRLARRVQRRRARRG
ncbi:uncharacterized protein LOC143265541 [Megachile rotundata]|uniref:uncharacterized protein LOC143265541 n=1 Tax=Megachile rotundata TaxID=143995 RepID=UPI003FD20B89